MSRKQVKSEKLADYYVKYLLEKYGDTSHVRRVASWIGLIVLAVERIAEEMGRRHTRQLGFTLKGRTFKAKYDHSIGGRGGIQVVEVLSRPGSPEGGTVTSITSLSEAEQFYNDAEEVIQQFLRQARISHQPNRPLQNFAVLDTLVKALIRSSQKGRSSTSLVF